MISTITTSPASPTSPSVVIVGESSDSREVLSTALFRRGVTAYAAEGEAGLHLVQEHRPRVVVLDLEAADDQTRRAFSEQSCPAETKLVVLGNLRREATGLKEGQFVAKPYHYAPLIRKIEQLIQQLDDPDK